MTHQPPPPGRCRRWVVLLIGENGFTATWCGQADARLYPCGWRCEEHAPQGGVGR